MTSARMDGAVWRGPLRPSRRRGFLGQFCLNIITAASATPTAAPAFLEGGPKRRLLRNRLRFGIDTLIPDLGVFRPRWDQAPTKLDESARRGVGFNPYGHHGLRWSDVVAGLKERKVSDLELFGNDVR